ncbi:MAG: hypothetical protein F6K10_32845, partial [Moorea sp. SIO2B7]|nr:hypothetical protein [Moorena sp. SIO2B7]
DNSEWTGTYQEIQNPYPGYQLCLNRKDQSVAIDIWPLCFQVCFLDYQPTPITSGEEGISSHEVEIDTRLIDETGDVDWQLLESKTQKLVKQVFANLPRE